MAVTFQGTGKMTPAPIKQTLATNYIDFTSADEKGWAQQYLPDLIEKEAEIFGNRTISGFLSKVGAEESMSSDQVIWSEQGRLHLTYTNCTLANQGSGSLDGDVTITMTAAKDVDGVTIGNNHGVRPGDMLLVRKTTVVKKFFVNSVASGLITAFAYDTNAADMSTGLTGSEACTIMVFGSEYVKGSVGREGANKPQFQTRTNKPIILKDKYEISGSDAAQIGWVEISGEDGQNGYYWYLKASGDTKARFNDYLEMAMLESEKSTANAGSNPMVPSTITGAAGKITGTEGLFAAINDRGHVTSDFQNGVVTAEVDDLLSKLDEQGAIEENMMFLNRTVTLNFDDWLASLNAYHSTGTSWGVFNNSEEMALNLGFTGWRRGSYDFYKSDFKYLNDKGTRGSIGNITGVMIPAGVSTVYDEVLGRNLKRPFLHVRFRASNMESRKYKTWTTGSVGATTSDLDAMEMHFLSERCLVVQGANNFLLMTAA
jgi:hypothetical protein